MKKNLIPELKNTYEEIQNHLQIICNRFKWSNREHYLSWLAQTYEYAVCSTRILALAGGRMPLDKTYFATRFIAHAAEEKGHEILLENDIRNFGCDINKLEVFPESKAFHQSLYYWLSYGNPIAVLGWVLALEGFSVLNINKILETCDETYGPKFTTFLKVHANEEEEHLEKAFEVIKTLNNDEIKLVSNTLYQYGHLYGNIYEKIEKKFSKNA